MLVVMSLILSRSTGQLFPTPPILLRLFIVLSLFFNDMPALAFKLPILTIFISPTLPVSLVGSNCSYWELFDEKFDFICPCYWFNYYVLFGKYSRWFYCYCLSGDDRGFIFSLFSLFLLFIFLFIFYLPFFLFPPSPLGFHCGFHANLGN